MKIIFKMAVVISCITSIAIAKQTEYETIVLANSFGRLLAAEEYCGLEFDQNGIDAYLEKYVDADNMFFSDFVDTEVWASNENFKEYTKSQKRTFCSQQKRVAKHHKLIK